MMATDRLSRGLRVQEIQRLCGDEDNTVFSRRLNRAAHDLGLPEAWNQIRLAKVRTGTQDINVDDITVLSHVDPQKRGWTYVAYGIPTARGEDAWLVLTRIAKRSSRG